jgi:hypothetical protein
MSLRDSWDWMLSLLHLDRETRKARAALTLEIERLVQEVTPTIRNVRGYRKQLRVPVEEARTYVEGLIAAIPGPLPLSTVGWGRDSPAEPLFIDVDQVRGLFRDSAALQSFFQQDSTPQAVALLTATRHEKTIYTSEFQGEILQRDVPHIAVDFTDHRIVSPAATETLNRLALREAGLRLLGLRALEDLTNLKSQKEELTEEKRMMGMKLKVLQAHNRSLEGMLESDRESEGKAAQVRKLLAEIGQELDKVMAVLGTPEDALRHLLTFLNHPEDVLTFQILTLRLNWMGVKVDGETTDPVKEICLAELEIKARMKRVAGLITVNREEILNQK